MSLFRSLLFDSLGSITYYDENGDIIGESDFNTPLKTPTSLGLGEYYVFWQDKEGNYWLPGESIAPRETAVELTPGYEIQGKVTYRGVKRYRHENLSIINFNGSGINRYKIIDSTEIYGICELPNNKLIISHLTNNENYYIFAPDVIEISGYIVYGENSSYNSIEPNTIYLNNITSISTDSLNQIDGERVIIGKIFPKISNSFPYFEIPRYRCPSIEVDAENENYTVENGCLLYENKEDVENNEGVSLVGISRECTDFSNLPNTIETLLKHSVCNVYDESIILPDSVRTIKETAFYNSGLNKLTISKNVSVIQCPLSAGISQFVELQVDSQNENYTSIDKNGQECNVIMDINRISLIRGSSSFTIPDGIEIIENGAFDYQKVSNKQELPLKIVLPDTVKELGPGAFYTSDVSEITLSSNLEKLGDSAFNQCNNLTTVKFKTNSVIVGIQVFANCKNLSNIYVNDEIRFPEICKVEKKQDNIIRVPCIPSYFLEQTSINDLNISATTKTIDSWAFYGCNNLQTVVIPNEVTVIGNYAFYYCRGLESIILGNSISELQFNAFRGCSQLKKIFIPLSIHKIGTTVFDACPELTIYYEGSEDDWNHVTIESTITQTVVPNTSLENFNTSS